LEIKSSKFRSVYVLEFKRVKLGTLITQDKFFITFWTL
jgi:hypothetical protein